MSFYQLSLKNFSISNGPKRTLDINIEGKVLLFIKMEGCPGCNSFFPIFHELSKMDKRINYAVFDITNQRQVVVMARETSTPIENVPFILMYNNGSPFAKYKGKKSFEGVQNFITTIIKMIESTPPPPKSFMNDTPGGYSPFSSGSHVQPPSTKVYMPETNAPSGSKFGQKQPTNIGEIEDEDDILMIPDEITPYNTPWKSDYKRMPLD